LLKVKYCFIFKHSKQVLFCPKKILSSKTCPSLCYLAKNMMTTLLKKSFCSAVLACLLVTGAVFAQTPNPPVKRNSPYSPNPKKRVEVANNTTQPETKKAIEPTTEPNNDVQIVKVEATVPNQPDTVSNNPTPNETAQNNPPKTEVFESRSIASKTLEVAKKASAVAVSPMEVYKIGIGDVLFISLQNAPAKNSTYFTVLNNGTIDYPLAGEMVQVLDLTSEQIEDLLKEKIKLYESPQVSVKVREHNSHKFTALGLVEKSGELFMEREALPLFIVRAKANVSAKANRLILKRGNQTQAIDLRDSKSGDTLIFPNDIIEFTSDEVESAKNPQFYYIGGEIVTGGKKDFTVGITLTQAIIESGGLKKSSVRKVVIRRKNNEGLLIPTEFDLKSIKDGKIADPVLQIGDTIEIGNQ
jgi:protein involved in polysaccharide export with SLBB domain